MAANWPQANSANVSDSAQSSNVNFPAATLSGQVDERLSMSQHEVSIGVFW